LLLHLRPDRRTQRALQHLRVLLAEGGRRFLQLRSSRSIVALAAAGVLAGALVACPEDEPPVGQCDIGILGDPNMDPVIELRALRADGTDVPLRNGDDLAVLFPPQGGRVAFVGARVINVDGCGMQIVGALRDPLSRQIRLDGRTLNLRREPDGWGTTGRGSRAAIEVSDEIGDYSNIPLCGNQWANQDVYDVPFELEVVITDRRKKTATAKIMVTPRCAEPAREAACRCLCKKGYVLGEDCGEDAGSDAPPP
jgi:hypothetical protein